MALTTEQMNTLREIQQKRNAQPVLAQQQASPVMGTQPEAQPMVPGGDMWKGAGNVFSGAVQGLASAGRTVQSFLPRSLSGVGNAPRGNEMTREQRLQQVGADPNEMATKVGEFAGEVAPYLAQPGAAVVKGATGFLGRTALDTAIGTAQTGDIKEGATIGVAGQAINIGGKVLQAFGKGLYKASIPLSSKEAVRVQAYKASAPFFSRVGDALSGEYKGPITNADTAFRNGMIGTEGAIGVQATKAKKAIWDKTVKPALESVDAKINLDEFFGNVQESILKNTPELTRQKSLLKAMEAIKKDYEGVQLVSASKLQDLKSGWAEFVPEKAYKGENIAGALNDVRKQLAGEARNIIYDAVDNPNIKQAYIDYGNLTNLQKWGQKAMTGGKLKGGAGSFISALKDAILVPVATVGGKVVYKTAQGIEFIGNAGAKTLNDIVNSSEE